METFFAVIIGGGPGGMRAARLLAEAKKSVALVCDELGGECLNWGCIPAKAFLFAEELIDYAQRASQFGVLVDYKGIDFAQIMRRKTAVVQTIQKQTEQFLNMIGVTLFAGRGSLQSPADVFVKLQDGSERKLRAERIIIATGSDARLLPGMTRSEKIIVSNDIFKLKEVPKKLAIVGGGAVGVEFASAFRAFGSEVKIIEGGEHLLPSEDAEIGKTLAQIFAKRGISVQTNTMVESLDALDADKVLIAVGRAPSFNIKELDAIGVNRSKSGIETNDTVQTTVDTIYAIGDVAGKALLAYTAEREAEIAVAHMLGKPIEPLNYTTVPNTIFCHPEVASVGLMQTEAGEQAISAKGYYSVNGKAQILGATDGFCKVVVDKNDLKLLGVHIVGVKATELIHEASLALANKLTLPQILKAVHAHPVLSEIFQDALHRAEKLV